MKEAAINPDNIWGKEFRVPAIVGEGSGKGFRFSGLHIPKDWDSIAENIKCLSPNNFKLFFEERCESFQLKPGSIKFDHKTGLLKSISVKTEPVSSLKLDFKFVNRSDGIYQAENVKDLKTAIVLQRVAGAWLANLWNELDPNLSQYYALIDGRPGIYYSTALGLPKEFLNDDDEPLTNTYFQDRFYFDASNIAGRFGLTLRTMKFNPKGIPVSFDINEGNACGYYMYPSCSDNRYHGHNIDTPEQVAVLHGIGASFINHLLRRKLDGYY